MSMIKINVNVPAGPHYAQYTIEVPPELIAITEGIDPNETQEQIANFAATTISSVHKATSGSQEDGGSDHTPTASTSETMITSVCPDPAPIEASQFVKITLTDWWTDRQTSYHIRKNENVHSALRGFADQVGMSVDDFDMFHRGIRTDAAGTLRSVSMALPIDIFASS